MTELEGHIEKTDLIKEGEVAEKQEEIDQLRKTLTDAKYDNETYQ